jgi:hypothetical protein
MSRCECDLRYRRWNPNVGRCETCLCTYEQPMPIPQKTPAILDLVIADIQLRDRVGVERYGERLRAHNGRDTLRDAYEEALDLAFYLRQLIEERATAKVST